MKQIYETARKTLPLFESAPYRTLMRVHHALRDPDEELEAGSGSGTEGAEKEEEEDGGWGEGDAREEEEEQEPGDRLMRVGRKKRHLERLVRFEGEDDDSGEGKDKSGSKEGGAARPDMSAAAVAKRIADGEAADRDEGKRVGGE